MTDTAPETPPQIVEPRPGLSRRTLYLSLAVVALFGVGIAAVLGAEKPKTADGPGLAIAVQPAPKPAPIAFTQSGEALNALPDEAASLPANPGASASPAPVVTPASTAPESDQRPSRANPAFDCEGADSRAERMICADPRLAADDRRMDRLYHQALDAGVPARILRRQQRDFLDAREAAARQGPDAVADVYGERIAELQGMAQGY